MKWTEVEHGKIMAAEARFWPACGEHAHEVADRLINDDGHLNAVVRTARWSHQSLRLKHKRMATFMVGAEQMVLSELEASTSCAVNAVAAKVLDVDASTSTTALKRLMKALGYVFGPVHKGMLESAAEPLEKDCKGFLSEKREKFFFYSEGLGRDVQLGRITFDINTRPNRIVGYQSYDRDFLIRWDSRPLFLLPNWVLPHRWQNWD